MTNQYLSRTRVRPPSPIIRQPNFLLETTNTWEDKLRLWEAGIVQVPPPKPCFWRTSPCNKNASSRYLEEYTYGDISSIEDRKPFKLLFERRKYVFVNSNADTILVIPAPSTANAANLATYSKTATIQKQRLFWISVATAIRNELKNMTSKEKLYISTHGSGVAYLHVRVSKIPKYYDDSKMLI